MPVLHVREVNRAEDVAFDGEATEYIGCKSDIVAFIGCQTRLSADSLVEVLGYCETVGLRVVIDDMDDNALIESDVHYGPWVGGGGIVSLTAVVAHIQAFICHYDSEDSGVGGARRADPAARNGSEEVKRVGSRKKPS